jgi:hypothetical protein
MYNTIAHDNSITIRLAGPEHAGRLRRLAERDSSEVPAGELLVAVVGSELRAAVSIRGGETLADPFHPTREVLALLNERARQLRGPEPTGLRARLRGRRRSDGRARLSPQPAGTMRAFR